MTRETDTTSLAEFSEHLQDHLTERRVSGRPLFITTDGKPHAVVMSPNVFDELVEQAELAKSLQLIDRSRDDIAAGRVRPAKQAIRDIATELNLKLGV